jgi:tetratricopeptide (TPR) repeat protein
MNMRANPAILLIALNCLAQPLHSQPVPPDQGRIMPPGHIIPPMPPMPPPRIELRVPDVGPMQTREISIHANVSGLHAVVETTLVFHNPNARELEGELVFPLPDGAAVCGYALDINGALVDGVVVPKDRARVAFETETRRKVDPGLVEHVQGNLYRTRIYPLPAKGERRIRLTYTTPLATATNGDAALLLPLPREAIAKLDVKIEVAALDGVTPEIGGLGDNRFEKADQIWRVESSSENTTPGQDLLIALPKLPASFHRIETDPDGTTRFMITTLAPAAKPRSSEPGLIHVLWDASGSRAGADLTKEFALLANTKASGYRLTIFRDMPETARDFATPDELIAAIKDAPFDGGTNLAALAASLREAPAPDKPTHTLLFTDGLDTLSGQTLEFAGGTTVAVVSQNIANREALRQACAGALIDLLTTDAESAWSEIESPSSRITGIEGTGVAQVQGIGRPALGRVYLLGRLTSDEATVRIVYADGSTSDPFALRKSEAKDGRVLATAWAAARVNQLAPRAGDFEDELLALGRAHGLVSPATSLIVLESLDQWVRHEIEPPATLPEMRRQWRETMKGRPNSNKPGEKERLEQVVALWQQRVEWWKTDFSKAKPASPQKPGLLNRMFGSDDGQRYNRAPAAPAAQAVDAFAAPAAESVSGLRSGDAAVTRDSIDATLGAAANGGGGSGALRKAEESSPADATIEVKPWNPDSPYLKAIRKAKPAARYTAYLAERKNWSQSPAFFLDCAEVFYQNKDTALARRILSNLAELRIEDASLLRVFASRLRQAGELDLATVVFRRVAKLRPEEPQSFRDLALVLAERGRASMSKADLEEAMNHFLHVALGTWNRHSDTIAIFALEELNALVAWAGRQDWPAAGKPAVPNYDKRLRANLDTDIRIVLTWDADATDIDLHVMEPGGEEAFYGHNRTARGGLVSEDITDGYGPEEYLVRIAPAGKYAISTNYFGSHQQTITGPATITATVFTHWGRPNEKRQTLTLRLDKPKDKVEVGSITFGRADLATEAANLTPGLTRDQVIAILGKPKKPKANPLAYPAGPKTILIHFDDKNTLLRVTETLPGGIETILIQ